jgi:hypothetical protein
MSRTYTPRHYTPKIEPRHRGRNDTNASYTAENGVRASDPWTDENGTYHPGYETADIDVRRMADGHLRIELYRLAPGTVVVVGNHTLTCTEQDGWLRSTVTHTAPDSTQPGA